MNGKHTDNSPPKVWLSELVRDASGLNRRNNIGHVLCISADQQSGQSGNRELVNYLIKVKSCDHGKLNY